VDLLIFLEFFKTLETFYFEIEFVSADDNYDEIAAIQVIYS